MYLFCLIFILTKSKCHPDCDSELKRVYLSYFHGLIND